MPTWDDIQEPDGGRSKNQRARLIANQTSASLMMTGDAVDVLVLAYAIADAIIADQAVSEYRESVGGTSISVTKAGTITILAKGDGWRDYVAEVVDALQKAREAESK